MIATLGNIALYIVFFLNILSCVTLGGLFQNRTYLKRYIKFYTDLTFILLSFAFVLLVYAFYVTDFSLAVVMNNSHLSKPLIYKISGVWGNHEGSMLLWLWLFSAFNMLFLYRNKFTSFDAAKILGMQSLILSCFLLFVITKSNPFISANTVFPIGRGLNPLLQDLGLLIHPPALYLGLVNFSLGFSVAIIGLLKPNLDNAWFVSLKPWLIFPWTCLTAGIGLGSWWAYRELGWGGFWFFDPVENASLLPWLLATASIHSIKLSSIRGHIKLWSPILAILTFLSTIFATFLVRSGIVTSVHSFAIDASKGRFILGMLLLFIIIGIIAVIKHKRTIPTNHLHLFSKDSGIIFNNILLVLITIAITAGILYPVAYQYLYGQIVEVNKDYYIMLLKISSLAILVLTSAFSFLRWENDYISANILTWLWLSIASTLLTIASYLSQPIDSKFILVILTFAYFLAINLLVHFIKNLVVAPIYFRKLIPMFLSHFGLALTIIAISLNVSWQQEVSVTMKVGNKMLFTEYVITLAKIENFARDNYYVRQATLVLYKNRETDAILLPETRYYPVEKIFTTECAIYNNFLANLYVTISEELPGNKLIVTLQYKPFINLMWIGFGLTVFGGVLSLLRKRSNT